MHRTWTLLGFTAAVFFLGALLAPWIYFATRTIAGHSASVAALAARPFPRFVGRTLLALTLIGLWPVAKSLQFSATDLGLTPPDMRSGASGALLGVAMLGTFIFLEMAAGARSRREGLTATKILRAIVTALGTAALVAVLEEAIFRGVLFQAVRGEIGWLTALVFSSVLFALAHFLQTPRGFDDVRWDSGLKVLHQMATLEAPAQHRIAQFINFTLCGILLGMSCQRTGTLWFAIGLHGGWVFCLKLGNHLTRVASNSPRWFWGTRKVIDGWATTALLLLVLAILPLLTRTLAPASHVHSPLPPVQNMG